MNTKADSSAINKSSDASAAPSDINQSTLKLLVGVIALTLAAVCNFFSQTSIDSISAAYFEGGLARDIFVGSLFAVSAFLVAYNGAGIWELCLSKIGAFAAAGVALFPCHCVQTISNDPVVLWKLLSVQADAMSRMSELHYIAAAALFLVLAEFCRIFYGRAKRKGHAEARIRMGIYTACGLVMIASLIFLSVGKFFHFYQLIPNAVYLGEQAGLMAFGLSWLTASKVVPGLATSYERSESGWTRKKIEKPTPQAGMESSADKVSVV